VHYTAAPVTGGVEAVIDEHARLLAGAGHAVTVIAGRGDCDLVPEVDSRHPDVEELAVALARGDRCEALYESLRDRITAALRPKLDGVDVVIAHNVMTMPFNLPLVAALTALPPPVIAWTHDLAWTNPRYAEYHRPGPPYTLLQAAQPGTRYVAISGLRRRELTQLFEVPEASVPVIPNGIDPIAFLDVSERTLQLVERAGMAAADPLLLVPVRITRRKRLELALRALAELRTSTPSAGLLVCGPLGPHSADNRAYATELQELRSQLGLERNAAFLSEQAAGADHPVDARAMRELYRLADVVLLTSESEGFGLPVLEAGLARVPVVAPDLSVLREVGGSDLVTFRLDAGPGEIAAAVLRALQLPASRLRSRVMRGYTWAAVLDRMEAEIEAAVGS
jgi:glycosyltransferase involved in cell wall biosynthesis